MLVLQRAPIDFYRPTLPGVLGTRRVFCVFGLVIVVTFAKG